MNCMNHPEVPAVAYCRTCGKAVCQACQRTAQGYIFCAEHVPAEAAAQAAAQAQAATTPATPWTSAAPPPQAGSVSPGLAFLLGLIPGVGAIYNGQYAKGVIHVVILGILISITHSGAAGPFDALFGMLIAAWFFYMAFEAYHTAKKRQMGLPVDEFSSIVPLRNQTGAPVGPVLLIGLGVLFLLANLGLLDFHRLIRYWPVFLIVLGAYMLYARLSGDSGTPSQEAPHER